LTRYLFLTKKKSSQYSLYSKVRVQDRSFFYQKWCFK